MTLPAASNTRRGASVVSAQSNATRSRKRARTYDLSSDEDNSESDYAPSEPDSPSAEKSARQAKKMHDAPVLKKARTGIMGSSAATSKPQPRAQVEKVPGKNGFGFKSKPTPKPMTPTKTQWREPAPLVSSSPVPASSPQSPSVRGRAPAPKAKPVRASNMAGKKFIPLPSKRAAARKAEDKIHGYFEADEEFRTECAIEDDVEEARLPEDMRRMSITPSPSDSQLAAEFQEVLEDAESGASEHDETVEMLVDIQEPTTAAASVLSDARTHTQTGPSALTAKDNDNTWTSWAHTRARGDRHIAKNPHLQPTVEDDDSEADISEYILVNGIIVRKDQVEGLDLTGCAQQAMISRAIGAGRPGREEGRGMGYWERLKSTVGCRMS